MFVQQSEDGPLLLTDISGSSSFLQEVADAHRDDALVDALR
jgi:hypothetical protein